ncbi:MAG: radical SAM protein [Bacteroidales bacterium]|nr:radical SAM protein [Bacteroidales bacterium]
MYDRFNRHINYLRISVTDRCNLRCQYCMPECGIKLQGHNNILSFEEIFDVVQAAVGLGITKIRLTGGEPLVRKNIVKLVELIASVKNINDFSLTTNGILLEELALPLKLAGLHRVNVSLDTTNPARYAEITRGGEIERVFRGIEAAKQARLLPVKINCVVTKNSQEPDALLVKDYCKKNGLEARYIKKMNLETGEFSVVEGGNGGNCSLCNRLRLTANGMVKPCLFDENEFSARELGAREALIRAINFKPLKGCLNSRGSFFAIGG